MKVLGVVDLSWNAPAVNIEIVEYFLNEAIAFQLVTKMVPSYIFWAGSCQVTWLSQPITNV